MKEKEEKTIDVGEDNNKDLLDVKASNTNPSESG